VGLRWSNCFGNYCSCRYPYKKTIEKTIREVSTETAEKIEADKKAEDEKSAKEK